MMLMFCVVLLCTFRPTTDRPSDMNRTTIALYLILVVMMMIYYYQLERSLACVYSGSPLFCCRPSEGSVACSSDYSRKKYGRLRRRHGRMREGGDDDRAIKCHRRYRYSPTRSKWVQAEPDQVLIIPTYHYGDCELIEPI